MNAAIKGREHGFMSLVHPRLSLDLGFDVMATAPDGISALRELVLATALRGRLDDPHRELLPWATGVANMRSSLLRRFSLPEGWAWRTIGELCTLRTGATPSTAKREYYGGDVRWLVSGDIHAREIFDCSGRITELAMANANCKLLPANSVLIALNGQGKTRATVAILRVPATCNQSLVAMTPLPDAGITPEFLYWNLRYRYREIRDITGQNQRRGLNMGLVSELSVAVPPQEEQVRIVARVDELMRLCDALEAKGQLEAAQHARLIDTLLETLTNSTTPDEVAASWQRVAAHFDLLLDRPAALEAFEGAVVDLGIRGRLVPQKADEGNVDEALKAIAAEVGIYRNEHRISASRAESMDAASAPFQLPPSWRWAFLDDLCKVITDGDHQPPPKSSSGIAFLTIGNVSGGDILFEDCRFVPRDYFERIAPYRRPTRGDVLYTVVGATYGRPVIVATDRAFCVQRHISILKPSAGLDVEYLHLVLKSTFAYDQATNGITGTAQPTVPLGVLRKFLVPLPPLAEQRRIVARATKLRGLCADLRQRLAAGQAVQSNLSDALVEQAVG